MHGCADAVNTTSCVRRRICPYKSKRKIPRFRTVFAVYDVAQPPDCLDEQHSGSSQIRDYADRMLAPQRISRRGQKSAKNASPESDASVPDGYHLAGIALVEAPVVNHVDGPGADYPADYPPGSNRIHVVGMNATQWRPSTDQEHRRSNGYETEETMPTQHE